MGIFSVFCFVILKSAAYGLLNYNATKYISNVAIGLSEIINGLQPSYLIIFTENQLHNEDVDDLVNEIHKLNIQTCIFFNRTKYFEFIENSILTSIESTSLIFLKPHDFSRKIHEKNLAHRLNLFIFYWGVKTPPKPSHLKFEEPIRAVVITRPREKAFRVFYNQAVPSGVSNLRLVNWYDEESLGLVKTPLLPSSSVVYSKFNGRIFQVPVIHAPPWFFVEYNNSIDGNSTNEVACKIQFPEVAEDSEVCVIGGRDHNLLRNIAKKMKFKIQYLDLPERTQGSPISPEENDINFNFSGGIGMLQNRSGDFLLGDISLNWERRKAVEFSFFTLADSGAFATHAPKRLNEALAVIRPFKLDVWPYLILTVLFSGPAFYFIIQIPNYWNFQKEVIVPKIFTYPEYMNEITIATIIKNPKKVEKVKKLKTEKNLLGRCIWFTLQLFLKQSCPEPYHGYRAKFLTIVYWIAATYVLSDVYSAQLTSQFARPARESPIDNLEKLEYAMKYNGYQLFVEKDSSGLQMLEMAFIKMSYIQALQYNLY